ncbi:MAG TPA: YetF domain-containing protein [Vicinamibacterales bacterium]|nr:YetF domain-containing protein [Vicinamibacterales bacterium]
MALDWGELFVPQTPLLETLIRGTLVYLGLFLLLRLVLKRQSGAVGLTDLLVIVLIADAAQNAMADDYRSIPDGLLLVTVIVFWSHALDWLGYRFPALNRLVHPPPLPLVRDGLMLRRNMRRELITETELKSQLREQGVADLGQVKVACMEGDGRISVVRVDEERTEPKERPLS